MIEIDPENVSTGEPDAPATGEFTPITSPAEKEAAPVTIVIALSWIAVYALMAWTQGRLHAEGGNWISGGIQPAVAAQFGSLTTDAVFSGQWQRLLTATFIHFSLVHLVINTIVFYQLGRVIEPWYGSGAFALVYVVLAIGSNLIASFCRPIFGQSALTQSGGGSGVICGMIALIAVVGWRQKSRFGDYILGQMGVQLILIGAMGMIIPHVDNLVHACGALTGLVLGLADPFLIRIQNLKTSLALGLIAILVGGGSIYAQRSSYRNDLASLASMAQYDQQLRQQLVRTVVVQPLVLRLAASPLTTTALPGSPGYKELVRERAILAAALEQTDQLDEQTHVLANDKTGTLARWRKLAEAALNARPSLNQISQFRQLEPQAVKLIEQEIRANLSNHQHLCTRIGVRSTLGTPPATPPPGTPANIPQNNAMPFPPPAGQPPAPHQNLRPGAPAPEVSTP